MLSFTLRIFMWKHYKAMRMTWVSVLLNLGVPIGLTMLGIHLYHITTTAGNVASELDADYLTSRFEIAEKRELLSKFHYAKLYYAPNTTATFDLMERVRQTLQIPHENVIGFASEAALTNYTQTEIGLRDFSIVFADDWSVTEPPMSPMRYTIRVTSISDYQPGDRLVGDYFSASSNSLDLYVYDGFIALQLTIDECLLAMQYDGGDRLAENVDIAFQKMPSQIRALIEYVPFQWVAMFAWIMYMFTLVNMVLVPMVEEKETGIREFLRIATTYYQLNLFTLYVVNVAFGVVIFVSIVAFASLYGMTTHFSILCAFCLILLYVASSVAYAFFVSVLFNTVFFAKNAGFLLLVVPWAAQFYKPIKFLMPIVSSTLFADGWSMFDDYGARAKVFGISNIFEHTAQNTSFSMFEIWMFMLGDTLIYVLLYTYLVQVFPGAYGIAEPYYYPLTSTWRLCCGEKPETPYLGVDDETRTQGDRTIVVRVRRLIKEFGRWRGEQVRVINNVNMNICENQISVLLGHNGAGKTTTMSIISGIIPKTSGEIMVNGETDVDTYRRKIGYCPQHNVFLPYFTVQDHLMFFSGLRGLNIEDATESTKTLLDRLQLTHKANEYGKDLSGGMKRRLCIGNALVGDTKIAILDEPSSGLDPESRRELWNILIEMRKKSTILITTHYMEEADTLADYIYIMSRGEILCHGSALQLKNHHADGYVLKLLVDESFNTAIVMERLRRRIPGVAMKSFVRPTLNLTLPYTHMVEYSDAIADLEVMSEELGITSISLTNASLEEVFLNCDPHKHVPDVHESASQASDQVDAQSYSPLNEKKQEPGCMLSMKQMLAVFYKKSIYVYRHWIRLVISLCFLAIAIYFGISTAPIPRQQNATETEALVPMADVGTVSFGGQPLALGGLLALQLQNENMPQVQNFHSALLEQVKALNVTILNMPADQELEKSLLALEKQNIFAYHERVIGVLSVRQRDDTGPLEVLVLYSGNVLHSSARAMNLLTNVLARMLHTAAHEAGSPLQVTTINHPMPMQYNQMHDSNADSMSTEWFKILMPTALFYYMLFYVHMPFAETNTEFKQLQIISPCVYWLAFYAFDLLLHVLVCAAMLCGQIILDRAQALSHAEHTELFSFYVMYGVVYLPLVYVASQLFCSISSVYSFLTYMFVAPAVPVAIFTLTLDTLHKYDGWISLLMILPDYAIRHAINVFLIVHPPGAGAALAAAEAEGNGEGPVRPALDDALRLEKFYVYTSVVGFVLLAFLVTVLDDIYRRDLLRRLCRAYRPILRALRCCRRSGAGGDNTDGQAVANGEEPILRTMHTAAVEKERDQTDAVVKEAKVSDYAIVVTQLRKLYDGFPAVCGLDFAVKRGECFGLLGMNGAGKTTTFKMMTRDLPITNGDIYFKGLSSRKQASRYRMQFGYCPQVDALNGWMTAYETLKYMAIARGVCWRDLDADIRRLLRNMDLEAYADIVVSKYSGGTKRKLNTAMAMLTDPSLVFLDEPTTGVDPSSRRFMWACIQECQRQNKNIVLTTHSMDECEFLCNRLAIMNHGRLNCIGPIQQLKRSFGLGYLIMVLLRDGRPGTPQAAQVKQAILDNFPCVLREEYGKQLCFQASDNNIVWSEVFKTVFRLQRTWSCIVEDISLSESSLEAIFLQISQEAKAKAAAVA